MIYRYFLNLYRFTDKNLILKCHFNGYFRVFLSKMGTLNLSNFDQRETETETDFQDFDQRETETETDFEDFFSHLE